MGAFVPRPSTVALLSITSSARASSIGGLGALHRGYRGDCDRGDGGGPDIIFRSGRDFAAWIGLVPRQDSTGGKQKLGPISKQGDRYLRRILVVGAIAVLRHAQENPGKFPWLTPRLG